MTITESAPTVEAIMEKNESSARHMANDAKMPEDESFRICMQE